VIVHEKIITEGEIEVCSDCLNWMGYNVNWEDAVKWNHQVESWA
jgi:hypothetical protein